MAKRGTSVGKPRVAAPAPPPIAAPPAAASKAAQPKVSQRVAPAPKATVRAVARKTPPKTSRAKATVAKPTRTVKPPVTVGGPGRGGVSTGRIARTPPGPMPPAVPGQPIDLNLPRSVNEAYLGIQRAAAGLPVVGDFIGNLQSLSRSIPKGKIRR